MLLKTINFAIQIEKSVLSSIEQLWPPPAPPV